MYYLCEATSPLTGIMGSFLLLGVIIIVTVSLVKKANDHKIENEEFYNNVVKPLKNDLHPEKEIEIIDNVFLFNNESKRMIYYNIKNKQIKKIDCEEIIKYEIINKSSTKISGSSGRTIAGGLFFGPLGALAGTAASKKVKK